MNDIAEPPDDIFVRSVIILVQVRFSGTRTHPVLVLPADPVDDLVHLCGGNIAEILVHRAPRSSGIQRCVIPVRPTASVNKIKHFTIVHDSIAVPVAPSKDIPGTLIIDIGAPV